jgi:hypothetical protein
MRRSRLCIANSNKDFEIKIVHKSPLCIADSNIEIEINKKNA